jgi:hypothetical protein
MKTILSIITVIAITIATISCKSKSQKSAEDYMKKVDQTVKESSPSALDDKEKQKSAVNIPADMKGILGEWRLAKKLRDDNGNHIIDAGDTEVKSNNYMKFNADGTCKFEELMDGTYEIITEADGRKKISIHDLQGTAYPYSLYVLSVTESELTINLMSGGSQFDIYKRP